MSEERRARRLVESSATRSTTAIVMADNRAPSTASTPTYPALAFALNALYACGHGHDLLYYRMALPTRRRASAAGRARRVVLQDARDRRRAAGRVRLVAFVDSDSSSCTATPRCRCSSRRTRRRRRTPPPRRWVRGSRGDLPQLGERPNGGFHLWRRGDGAERLLRTWWHLDGGRFNTAHDYEQHALQWALWHLADAAPLMGTLQLKSMDDTFHEAIAHIDHTKAERRLWVMATALVDAALELPPERTGVRLAAARRAALARMGAQTAAAPPNAPPDALRARALTPPPRCCATALRARRRRARPRANPCAAAAAAAARCARSRPSTRRPRARRPPRAELLRADGLPPVPFDAAPPRGCSAGRGAPTADGRRWTTRGSACTLARGRRQSRRIRCSPSCAAASPPTRPPPSSFAVRRAPAAARCARRPRPPPWRLPCAAPPPPRAAAAAAAREEERRPRRRRREGQPPPSCRSSADGAVDVGDGALCLGAFRVQVRAGAALVFTGCGDDDGDARALRARAVGRRARDPRPAASKPLCVSAAAGTVGGRLTIGARRG